MNQNQMNRGVLSNKRSAAAMAMLIAAVGPALPALAQQTISQIIQNDTPQPYANVTMDTAAAPATITSVISQPETVDGYTYTKWAFLANDTTGSMDVYGVLPSGTTEPAPTVGDKITAGGTYYPFDGIPELETLTALSNVGTGGAAQSPVTVTIPQMLQLASSSATANNIQGYLLTLDNVSFYGLTTGGTSLVQHANNQFYASDTSSNSIEMYLYASSYSTCGQLVINSNETLPTTPQDVTGLVEIYKGTPEFVPMSWVNTTHTTPPPPTNTTTLNATAFGTQIAGSSTTAGILSVTNSGKSVTANVGTYINTGTASAPTMVFATLKYSTADATLQLASAGGTPGTDSTYYATIADGAHGGPATNYPIPTGSTGTANIGYNPSDTGTAGATIQGSLQIQNSDNGADSTIHVTLNPVQVLEQRDLNAGASTGGSIVGDVLVGTTGTTSALLNTANTDTSNTTSSTLTNVTLLANSTSASYTEKDPFTSASVATITATTPNYDQVFGGPNQQLYYAFNNAGTTSAPLPGNTQVSGTINLSVAPLISGTYGTGQAATVGTTTETYNATYTSFTGTAQGVVGMGIPGENESVDAYAQFTGFQPASVSASGTLTSTGGNVTLTNAATNDNIATENGSTANFGVRDSAWVSSLSSNQDGWSTTATAATPGTAGAQDTPGTSISGSQSVGDSNVYSTVVGFTYVASSALAGSYSGGTYTIGLENAQDDVNNVGVGAANGTSNVVLGATHNDLAPVTVALPNETGTGTGGGAYNFGGGIFVASGTTNLTGSFTQTGGNATFNKITGSGAVTISGGTAKLALGHTSSTIAALTITGTGLLDITNNTLTITGGSLAPITALIAQAYNGGLWTGPTGITSSSAASQKGTAVGVGLSGSSVVVKYTWYGDLTLDGYVNSSDLTAMNYGQAHGLTGWANGDLNYDNVINQDDYSLFMLGDAESGGQNIGPVPEPMGLSLLALPVAMGLRRRRR